MTIDEIKNTVNDMFLVAEYCDALYYTGWHLYYRDNQDGQRNNNGDSGWIRRPQENEAIVGFFDTLGLAFVGDGTRDDDAIAAFHKMYPQGCRFSFSGWYAAERDKMSLFAGVE